MTDVPETPTPPSEVAMWRRRSGMPDNVTDDGEIVSGGEARRQQAEKDQLRREIAALSDPATPDRARSLARLAGSYLLAGDAETARRYVERARVAATE